MAESKATIVVFSGDMDKVFAAFIIATGAAAAGMDTTLFFTFWGLKAIQKGNLTGKGFMGRMLGLMNRGGINRIGPSKFNFGGMGRWMFKKMMSAKGVTPLDELRETRPGRASAGVQDEHGRHGDRARGPDRRGRGRGRRGQVRQGGRQLVPAALYLADHPSKRTLAARRTRFFHPFRRLLSRHAGSDCTEPCPWSSNHRAGLLLCGAFTSPQ